jgi:ribosomal protein L6P/L9E
MIKHLLRRHLIKIPFQVNAIYIPNQRSIILSNSICRKLIKLNVQILVNKSKRTLYVSQISFSNKLIKKQKQLASYRGTTTYLFKQCVLELFTTFYQKLKFVGVGYRVFNINNFKNQILLFKLGYSHFLYVKVKDDITTFNSKTIKLVLFGRNYHSLTQMLFLIRSFKKPEPYKGKGIFYATENIRLKKSKKV